MNAGPSGTKPVITNCCAPAAIARRIWLHAVGRRAGDGEAVDQELGQAEAIRQAGVCPPPRSRDGGSRRRAAGPDRLVKLGRHALALEREAERVVGAGRQRHLDVIDRCRARSRPGWSWRTTTRRGRPACARRPRAPLDRGQRERDHLGRQAEADDHAVGNAPGQLQRARALGGQIDRARAARARWTCHMPSARVAPPRRS